MINLEDGSVLTGKDCPRKRNMEAWLQQHPGYMIDNSICLLDPYLADMRASLASRSSRDDKESGSSRHSSEKGMPLGMEGGAGTHKLSSSQLPLSASGLPASTSPPVSLRMREHHQMMDLGEREEEPNPQFVLNTPEIKPETFVRRRGRKPQLDPRTLDIDRLTGNENVAVVERGSGKKGVLPKSMDNRILRPSGRGRKPREPLHHSQLRHLNSEAQQQQQQQASHPYPPASLAALSAFPGAAAAAAAMMGNFPKLPMGLPFTGLPGLPGMGNPLLGLQGLGIPGMGLPPHLVKAMEEELREREKEIKGQEKLRERDSWGGEGSKERSSERKRSSSGSQPDGSGEDSRQLTSRQTDSAKSDYVTSSSRQAAAAAAAAAQAAALAAASSGMKGMSAEQAQQAFAPYLFNPMLYNPLLAAAASQGLQGIQGLGLPTTLAGMLPPGLVLPPHSATSPINSSQPSESESSTSHKSSSSALPLSYSSGTSSKHHHHHHRDDHHRHHEHHQHHDKRRKMHRQELQEQRHSSPPSSSSTPPTYHSSSSKTSTPASYAAEDLSVKVSKSQRSSSASPLSPSLQVQDLSVKRQEESSNQDHATDLSVRPKLKPSSVERSPQRDGPQSATSHTSSSTTLSQSASSSGKIPSSSLKVPHKNKIQGSLKLNKILDSLKDRVLKTDPVGKEKAVEQIDQSTSNDGEDSQKA
ncbi:chromodomain-helicase-DNA-binding protein 9 [Elysia marginata]|uniref:Chromodomain-helicase-DNA-binding protein 9 n=1 Tax=Elysia marginata TaxID=1093978 RepID=A0AAV4FMF0_9GAST|nr:chromodomain-helicase-DNA-binding protein 9 [Elysia marginata]